MIGSRIRVSYADGTEQSVEVTHYALGRLARWARASGVAGLSPDTAESMADQVLCIQVCAWAEATRGQAKPADFDAWVALVVDFDPEAGEPVDPTPPAM